MVIFSLFICNQSNKIDVRIGDETIKITTILTARAMLTSKKKYSGGGGGQEINRGGEGKNKNRGRQPLCPPTGDAPDSEWFVYYGPNPKTHSKPKPCPEKSENLIGQRNVGT